MSGIAYVALIGPWESICDLCIEPFTQMTPPCVCPATLVAELWASPRCSAIRGRVGLIENPYFPSVSGFRSTAFWGGCVRLGAVSPVERVRWWVSVVPLSLSLSLLLAAAAADTVGDIECPAALGVVDSKF